MNANYCEGCHYELKESEHQYCEKCAEALDDMINGQYRAWQRERRERFQDYEPEQAYGTAAHFRKHRRFGGTREDY